MQSFQTCVGWTHGDQQSSRLIPGVFTMTIAIEDFTHQARSPYPHPASTEEIISGQVISQNRVRLVQDIRMSLIAITELADAAIAGLVLTEPFLQGAMMGNEESLPAGSAGRR
jgi:hypothetical protein